VTAPLDADAFRGRGFRVLMQEADGIKAVKGRCEIHIRKTEQGTVLEIPVMRIPGDKTPSQTFLNYLLERNGVMNGPGFFGIREGCIYYRAIAGFHESIEQLALDMQHAVEQLGPKVINVARQ
jgi:hypothetical protein